MTSVRFQQAPFTRQRRRDVERSLKQVSKTNDDFDLPLNRAIHDNLDIVTSEGVGSMLVTVWRGHTYGIAQQWMSPATKTAIFGKVSKQPRFQRIREISFATKE